VATIILAADEPLAAPTLLELEVASALLRGVRRGEIAEATADRIVSRMLPQAVQLVEMAGSAPEASRLATRLGGAVYDAVYVVLARRLDAILVTADATQGAVARSAGVSVRMLDGLP
jgi:predicted nucleic acid-binding protein